MKKVLIYLIVGVIIFFLLKKLLNIGGCLGLIIGGFLGASIGVSGGGGAENGLYLMAGIGFVIGGLISSSINKKKY